MTRGPDNGPKDLVSAQRWVHVVETRERALVLVSSSLTLKTPDLHVYLDDPAGSRLTASRHRGPPLVPATLI